MSLSAAQIIFTNVEKKQSPTGRDGYQIWLRTPDALGEADEREVQSRLSDYEERREGDEAPVRHLFFPLASGKVVLARSVPLPQSDKFNRGGRFYAHAYVLSKTDFGTLNNDPFAVFDQVEFQSSLEDGLKAGDPARGTIPVALLEQRPAERVAPGLTKEKIAAVLPALLRACCGDKPVLIGVPGGPTQVLALTRELITWLPPTLRSALSFDTLSNGRNLTQVPFVVVGLPAAGPPRRYLNLLIYDVGHQAFAQPLPPSGGSSYEHWLLRHARGENGPPLLERSEGAYHLASCLDRGSVSGSLGAIDTSLFEEIACGDSGVPKLERLLRARLEADAGPALAPRLFALAYNWLRSSGLDGFKTLGGPIAPMLLLRWLLTIYEQRGGAEIERETEIPALKDVLESTKSVEGEGVALRKRLVLILYRWGKRWSNLARSLRDPKTIPDEIYSWFVEWSFRTTDLRVKMGAGFVAGGAWCGPQAVAGEGVDAEECQKLVGAVLGLDRELPAGPSPDGGRLNAWECRAGPSVAATLFLLSPWGGAVK